MTLLSLFWSFAQVGLFSIGGGYAAMPLIQAQVVDVRGWLSVAEFADLVTIAEMTPGPIAINAATFVGLRIAGVAGAVAATFGCILPSLLIVSLLARIYSRHQRGLVLQGVLGALRPAVVALIASAGLTILWQVLFQGLPPVRTNFQWLGAALFAAAFVILRKLRWSPILVMLLCGAAGLGIGFLETLP